MKEYGGKLIGTGLKVGIIISRFNDFFTKQLLDGAVDGLVRHGVAQQDVTVVWVPGANELPLVTERMAKKGGCSALIALGVVVQGATPHAELINSQVSRSLAKVGMDHDVPVINAVVCADNLE